MRTHCRWRLPAPPEGGRSTSRTETGLAEYLEQPNGARDVARLFDVTHGDGADPGQWTYMMYGPFENPDTMCTLIDRMRHRKIPNGGSCGTCSHPPRSAWRLSWRRRSEIRPVHSSQPSSADRLCRSPHRRDLELLSSVATTPPAPEVDQHARTAPRGDQAPHARGADLSQPGQLPPPHRFSAALALAARMGA